MHCHRTEIYLEVEGMDDNVKIVKAKARCRGLLFWHKINVEQLRDLICKEEEE